jgi:hypothetical protein
MTGTALLIPATGTDELTTICCHCRRLRTAEGKWEMRYLPKDQLASHGICPECFVRYYPDVAPARATR